MGFLSKLISKPKEIDFEELDSELEQKSCSQKTKKTQQHKQPTKKPVDHKVKKQTGAKGKTVLEKMITKEDNRSVDTSGKAVFENVLNPDHIKPSKQLENPKHKGNTVLEKLVGKDALCLEEVKPIVSDDYKTKTTEKEKTTTPPKKESPQKPEIQEPMPIDTTSPDEPLKESKQGFLSSLFKNRKKQEVPSEVDISEVQTIGDDISSTELETEKKKITRELDSLTKEIEQMIHEMEPKMATGTTDKVAVSKKPAVRKTKKPTSKRSAVKKNVVKKKIVKKPAPKKPTVRKKVVKKKTIKKPTPKRPAPKKKVVKKKVVKKSTVKKSSPKKPVVKKIIMKGFAKKPAKTVPKAKAIIKKPAKKKSVKINLGFKT